MTRSLIMQPLVFFAALGVANAYWLMGINDFITTQRLDPIVSPGKVSGHAHSVLGGSNFGFTTTTAQLRESECTSIPIPEDNSNYWFPHLYFQWKNGSFTSLSGGAVIYYLFDNNATGKFTAFPDDFRMVSGDPTLRSYNASSFAQQAVTFLCLDFNGVSTKHNELPSGNCPSGIRAQINFPSCWDGKNVDSPDHKSHVAFLSTGPDSGTCTDPNFPVRLPRIFMEVYWNTGVDYSQAMNTSQPFVFAHGDPTGYGYHADYFYGWQPGVLQNAVDNCYCNEYGDPTCCASAGIFSLSNQGKNCYITDSIDEQTTGTIPKLPGNNPVVGYGPNAPMLSNSVTPALISPVYAYTGSSPTATGSVVTPAQTASGSGTTTSTSSSSPTSTSGSSSASSPTTSTSSSSPTSTSGSSSASSPTSTSSGSTPSGSSTSSSSGSTGGSNPPASGNQPPASGNQSSSSSSSASSQSTAGGSGASSSKSGSSSTSASSSTSTSSSSPNSGGSGESSSPTSSGSKSGSSSTSASSSTSTSSSGSNNAGGYGGSYSSSPSGSSNAGSNNSGSSSSASSSSSSSTLGGSTSSPSSTGSSPATTSSTTTGSHNTGSGSSSSSSPASGSESDTDPEGGDDDVPTCSPPRNKTKKSKTNKKSYKSSFSKHHARRRFHSSMMKV